MKMATIYEVKAYIRWMSGSMGSDYKGGDFSIERETKVQEYYLDEDNADRRIRELEEEYSDFSSPTGDFYVDKYELTTED